MGIPITTAAMLYERLNGRVPVEQIGRALHVALPFDQSATQRFYLMLRRLFDVCASLVGCILLAMIIPLVWLANRFTSPGPLFYLQERVGKAGQTFWVIKFRSMIVDAEKYVGTVWASENDPRITPVGRLLRKIRLDEIPQFWNILKGEMSLIGPRPERPYFVNQLVQQYPFYRARHAVKPGLTGWAQVKYRYGASAEDSLMKLQYDLYYIKHQGASLDFEILLKTISVVLGFKGR
jgi:lipopolysaccharide/colanic/teichoic acid biosynthesis glycosyltransferase